MVASRGTLVNKESISKDVINKPVSCSQIILANSKESFKVNSLEVRCRNKGTKNLHKRLPFCKVKIIFKTFNRLKNYFSFKDVVPEPLSSCQIYNFTCGSCNASYIGKTFRHMKVRVSEYQGVSPRTGKHLKGTFSTSVRDHMLDYNHIVAWDDLKVLGRESNHWLLEIKESVFIKRDRPSLNKNIYSQELFLF